MTKKQTLWEATSLHCKFGKRRYLHVSNKRKTLSNCGKILPKDGCTSFQGFYWLTRCVKHWDALYIIIWLLNWILYVSKNEWRQNVACIGKLIKMDWPRNIFSCLIQTLTMIVVVVWYLFLILRAKATKCQYERRQRPRSFSCMHKFWFFLSLSVNTAI